MEDINLNWYRWIIYALGCFGIISSLLLIMVVAGIYLVKDYGDKSVKGKLTRSFEKFIYVIGWIVVIVWIIILIGLLLSVIRGFIVKIV